MQRLVIILTTLGISLTTLSACASDAGADAGPPQKQLWREASLSAPVATSQSSIVWSLLPLASSVPSGLKATEVTPGELGAV